MAPKAVLPVLVLLAVAGLATLLAWPAPAVLADQTLSRLLLNGALARSASGVFRMKAEALPERPGQYRLRFAGAPGWSFEYRPESGSFSEGQEVEVRLTAEGDVWRGLRRFTCDEIGGVQVQQPTLRCSGLLWDRPEPPTPSPPESLLRWR